MRIKWTDPAMKSQLESIIQTTESMAETLRALNLRAAGGNYATLREAIKRLEISTDHWKGQGWSKGRKFDSRPRRSLAEVLVEDSPIVSTWSLKNRLIREGILEDKCLECGISEWLDQPLALHLDHVNGKRTDNRLENLRLLCPNCHSQTDTYCGRNIGSMR